MAVNVCKSSDIKIIDCSVRIFNNNSMINFGDSNRKIIGPKYSIGKNGISYFDGCV